MLRCLKVRCWEAVVSSFLNCFRLFQLANLLTSAGDYFWHGGGGGQGGGGGGGD